MSITYTGPSVAATYVVGVINEAWQRAAVMNSRAQSFMNNAFPNVNAMYTALNPSIASNNFRPDLQPDAETVVSRVNAEDAFVNGQLANAQSQLLSKRSTLTTDLARDAEYFISEFFGSMEAYDAAMDWFDGMLRQGKNLPGTVEADIWARGRARIDDDRVRAEGEVNAIWAARGVPLTAQAAEYHNRRTRAVGLATQGANARQEQVVRFDTLAENTIWAIGRMIKHRSECMDICGTYVIDWTLQEYARLRWEYHAEKPEYASKLMNAYRKFYEAQQRMVEHINDKTMVKYKTAALQPWLDSMNLTDQRFDMQLKALVAGMMGFGSQAAGAISAVHVAAGYSGSEEV